MLTITLFLSPNRNLKPDGYAEFYECDYIYKSDDNSLRKDHEMFINCSEVVRAADVLGQDACPGPKLKKWFDDAGFVNVQEHVFKIPIGPWAKDPRLVSKTLPRSQLTGFEMESLTWLDYSEGNWRLEQAPSI